MIGSFLRAASWLEGKSMSAGLDALGHLASGGWRGKAAGYGLGAASWGAFGAGSYMRSMGQLSPTAWGATLGGLWGAASDDTSVVEGALMGAALGRYGGAGNKLMWAAARAGRNNFRAGLSYFGRGAAGQARRDWRMAYAQGRASASYIGATARRAYSSFRGLFR